MVDSPYAERHAEGNSGQLEVVFNKIAIEPDTKAFLANTGCDAFPGDAALASELIVRGSNNGAIT